MQTDSLKWRVLWENIKQKNREIMKYLHHLRNLKNKRVLVRVDMNVPMKGKKIIDDTKIRAHIPTITKLTKSGAKVLLLSHLGRPEGQYIASLSLAPVAERLSLLLKKKVSLINTKQWVYTGKKGELIQQQSATLRSGQVALFDNIRFAAGEEANDPEFATFLASLGDVFVLDGFAVAHRDAPSVTGITKYLPSYAGLCVAEEIRVLSSLLHNPTSPYVAVLGGAKLETKIPLIKKMSEVADTVLLGGALVNTYFSAKGYAVGSSLVEKTYEKQLLTYARKKHVIVPIDVVVGSYDGASYRIVSIEKKPHQICHKQEAILDIGPKTIQQYASIIKQSKTIVWNGAMGYFEQPPYHIGTMAIARLIGTVSQGSAFGVIGGGETIQAMEQTHMAEHIDFISTGGGAMLEFLSGKILPGVDALCKEISRKKNI